MIILSLKYGIYMFIVNGIKNTVKNEYRYI